MIYHMMGMIDINKKIHAYLLSDPVLMVNKNASYTGINGIRGILLYSWKLVCICIKHKIYNCPNGFISSYNLDLFIRFEA